MSSKSTMKEARMEILKLKKRSIDLEEKIRDCYSEREVKENELLEKREECKNLQAKIESLKKEIPIVEEELRTWKREKNEMEKNPSLSEDVEIWNEEIENIEDNLQEKVHNLKVSEEELQEIKGMIKVLQSSIKDFNKILTEKINIKTDINDSLLEKGNELIDNVFEALKSSDESLDLIKFIKEIKFVSEDFEVDLISFLNLARSHGLNIDQPLLDATCKVFDVKSSLNIPDHVMDFIVDCLDEPHDILELWPKLGSFTGCLPSKFPESQITAIIKDDEESEIFRTVYSNESILWEFNESKSFDTILTFESDKNDDEFIENLLNVLKRLKKDGNAFIILNKNFLMERNENSLLNSLEDLDISIEAIFNLPDLEVPDAILIILLKEKEVQKLFVGELTPNSRDILLKNFKDGVAGKIPQYGAFTELGSFFSFKNFFAQYESKEIAKNEGLESLKISEICEEINLPSEDEFLETPNALYLPIKELAANPTTLIEDLDDQGFYVQLVLDQERVLAEYVKRFFFTQLGQKIRESLNFEDYIPEIYRKVLENTDFYVPNVDEQVEILSVDSKINDIVTRTNSIKSRLWKKPKNVEDLLKEIESIEGGRSEQNLELWIESLPFPLASILWASITNPEYERKVKYLLQFFEAFSEFQVALMLSGLFSDKNFFEMEIAYELEAHGKIRDWYLKPSFGNWTYVGRTLAYQIRRLLRNNNTRYKCLKVFGSPNIEFLEYLADNELYKMLHEVSNYRNQWEGHGPIVSENEYRNRHKILRTYLSKIYQKTVNLYENTFLILPVQSIFREGVHNYTVKRFMSSRAPFKPLNVETTCLMDSNKIYLISENQRTPIEFLPFIHVKNESCYFYNDYNEKENSARFVSYHYAKEPEIFLPNDKVNVLKQILEHF